MIHKLQDKCDHCKQMKITPFIFIPLIFFLGCSHRKEMNVLFTKVDPSSSGVHFINDITEDSGSNILDYLYFYNGGGVAIGDINNDGLQDIYFTANRGSNKLYLNKGNFKFEDITLRAGVQGAGNWKTGVTMADVNGDGLLDIYVCEVGKYKTLHGRNELFINNGNNTFTESAKKFGLDIEGFNTQASFFLTTTETVTWMYSSSIIRYILPIHTSIPRSGVKKVM